MPDGVLAFIIAFITTMALTPFVRWVCIRYSLNAAPNPIIATHKIATPTLGGIAVYVSLLITLGILMIPKGMLNYFLSVVAISLPIFLMGVYDDLKGLSVKFKGLAEIILVLFMILVFKIRPNFGVNPVVDYLLMMLWFAGIINAINLIDIMDGLASGIGLFASIGFFALFSLNPMQIFLPCMLISGALVGAYLAFLYFNFNPAKIFLGDNGSLVMGLALAFLGFQLVNGRALSPSAMAPVILLAIPIFEVHLLILRRLKKKIPILKGSPDHLALVIQALGNSIPRTVIIIYGVSIILLILSIVIWESSGIITIAVSLFVLIAAALLLKYMRDVAVA